MGTGSLRTYYSYTYLIPEFGKTTHCFWLLAKSYRIISLVFKHAIAGQPRLIGTKLY